MDRVIGLSVSANTIERICLEVGNDLEAAEQDGWQSVLTGETPIPELAIVEFDGGRIRTREAGCGPGVHLSGKGWNETKNAIFVNAWSTTSEVDPQLEPPDCFLNPDHVAKLTEKAKAQEKQAETDPLSDEQEQPPADDLPPGPTHKPRRLLRTVISSMKNSTEFGEQMHREATRRKFDQSPRKAFVADGLTCNWSIHQTHFRHYTPILDFTHAVSYLFTASLICFGKGKAAWSAYCLWMKLAWRGKIGEVIAELRSHQQRIGLPSEDAAEDDPREQLRRVIGYLENNRSRMRYDEYRRQGLPTTTRLDGIGRQRDQLSHQGD